MLLFIKRTPAPAAISDRKHATAIVRCGVIAVLTAGFLLVGAETGAMAQGPSRYVPLNQNTPPGVAGQWAALAGKAAGNYFQPVQVVLPGGGQVTFHGAAGQAPSTLPAPGQAGLLVGRLYRIKISDMPRFPGVELYPSIELLDRLHPPRGQAAEFPVPVTFNAQEIELALDGRMVTKVVYLEQPQLANPIKVDALVPVDILRPKDNPLAAADLLGRPMAIVRLGGRVPVLNGDNGDFFGHGAPIQISTNHGQASVRKNTLRQSFASDELMDDLFE